MALNVQVTNNCKFITITAKSYINGSTGEIFIQNVDTGALMSPNRTIAFTGNNGTGKVTISVSDLPTLNGLYKICLIENGTEQVCKPMLIHCNLDCCLTKLTNELLDCACDCPKCSTTLAKSQKIFLLLQSAISTVSLASTVSANTGYYEDILEKYKKALELCDSSCGCDC